MILYQQFRNITELWSGYNMSPVILTIKMVTQFICITFWLMTVHHQTTFAYKRLSGSENIIQTKPRLTDTQKHTDGHKTHGPRNSNMPPLTSLGKGIYDHMESIQIRWITLKIEKFNFHCTLASSLPFKMCLLCKQQHKQVKREQGYHCEDLKSFVWPVIKTSQRNQHFGFWHRTTGWKSVVTIKRQIAKLRLRASNWKQTFTFQGTTGDQDRCEVILTLKLRFLTTSRHRLTGFCLGALGAGFALLSLGSSTSTADSPVTKSKKTLKTSITLSPYYKYYFSTITLSSQSKF